MLSFIDDLIIVGISYKEEREFEQIIESVFKTEPWHFVGQDLSEEYKWLCDIHKTIKLQLAS